MPTRGSFLEENVCLDVSANTRALSVLALHEAGREVSEAGLLNAVYKGNVSLVMLYLDAGLPIDCVDGCGDSPLHIACNFGHLTTASGLAPPSYGRTAQQHRSGLSGWRTRGVKWNSFMSYGVSTRKRTRWRTPAWTGRQRTRRTSTFDRCRRTRHPANGWGTAVNSPWKVYHLRRSVRAA